MTSLLTSPSPLIPSPVPLLTAREVPHPERVARRGDLAFVRRGVYAPGDAWRALAPWERYLARVHAVALLHPQEVFSHESAAALLGLPVFGDPGVVHVLRDGHGSAKVSGDVRIHTARVARDVRDAGGIAVTSPAETTTDLARARPSALALAVADTALAAERGLTVETLVATNEARASGRGRRQARWALHRATPLAETPLESISRAAVEWLGFPEPVLQHWFTSPNGERDRADMWWPEEKVVGEADGDLKYDGRFADPLAALRERRRRDARLREHARSLAHWAWDEIRAVTPLRSILLGAGVRRIRPEDTARLWELRHTLAGVALTSRPLTGAETVGASPGLGAARLSR